MTVMPDKTDLAKLKTPKDDDLSPEQRIAATGQKLAAIAGEMDLSEDIAKLIRENPLAAELRFHNMISDVARAMMKSALKDRDDQSQR
ncbi:MAG: hypothetical protein OXE94_08990 [Aestuariivita sp.]|nr:hypothetical protein [Aestuariivita sp.]MCY4201138.1 hypothetical protein [Aestuariivita sp.]MCY4287803.1 hypothetical protein [Aestuariivita sp.]MCY4345969.1 hypothetical protein [Aestuariivita sp.]